VNQVQDDFGPIDILINHAAVQPHVPLLDMDEWDWHRVLDVNLTGAFLMTQSAGRLMRERGKGVILNLVTEPDRVESGGRAAAFAASMSALKEFTDQAARELSPYGIHVFAAKNDPAGVIDQVFALLSVMEEQ
jgi:gluconate 5-dehydrogenase